MEHELFVVALGGNALLGPHEKGTTEEQMRNAERTCESCQATVIHLVERPEGGQPCTFDLLNA